MSTPASGSSPYCTTDQLVSCSDDRTVRQLLSDVGASVTGDLDDNPTLNLFLGAASGLVEAAAATGQRYIVDAAGGDLAALTGNSKLFLAKMVADLALHDLWTRRKNGKPGDRPPVNVERAEKFLEQLRLGERVFGILESHQAGALDTIEDTSADVERRRGVVVEATRFFGLRNNRLDGSGGSNFRRNF